MSFQSDFSSAQPTQPASTTPAKPAVSVPPVRPAVGVAHPLASAAPSGPTIHRWDEHKEVEKKSMNKKTSKLGFIIFLVVILAGIGTGLAGAYFFPFNTASPVVKVEDQQEVTDNQVKNGAVFGVPDEKTFKDQTEGVLIQGGIDGEGSHTILRAGGISQNVYLTSSVVDLDMFKDMEVRVWGETFKGQKAGWLMDVGRVEVLNTTATKPDWFTKEK